MKTENIALIITSIGDSNNSVLREFASECKMRNIPFIVIGDAKSPEKFELDGCDFWSLTKQLTLDFKLTPLLPEGHYSRKNLGYLIALKSGMQKIIETDDDNYPLDTFWENLDRSNHPSAIHVENAGWVNIYRHFSAKNVWPRGFPLEEINKEGVNLDSYPRHTVCCPIQQGLADKNPDVDALFRLTSALPLEFKKNHQVALGNNTWSPFNSQNTLWHKEAMVLMYLPSFCSFRMTDIWRSFIAQRIAWTNEWCILYHEPTVWQERNEHNLLRDFEEEVPGYLNNSKIAEALMDLDLASGIDSLSDNLIKCYDMMISKGWVKAEEATLVRAWCDDVRRLLY